MNTAQNSTYPVAPLLSEERSETSRDKSKGESKRESEWRGTQTLQGLEKQELDHDQKKSNKFKSAAAQPRGLSVTKRNHGQEAKLVPFAQGSKTEPLISPPLAQARSGNLKVGLERNRGQEAKLVPFAQGSKTEPLISPPLIEKVAQARSGKKKFGLEKNRGQEVKLETEGGVDKPSGKVVPFTQAYASRDQKKSESPPSPPTPSSYIHPFSLSAANPFLYYAMCIGPQSPSNVISFTGNKS
jgi:hypothetical protein